MRSHYKNSFRPSISKSLHRRFNPSKNTSPILLLNGLLMVTNERLVACKYLE